MVYDKSCRLDGSVARELRDAAKEYERVNLTFHEGMPLVAVRFTKHETHLGYATFCSIQTLWVSSREPLIGESAA